MKTLLVAGLDNSVAWLPCALAGLSEAVLAKQTSDSDCRIQSVANDDQNIASKVRLAGDFVQSQFIVALCVLFARQHVQCLPSLAIAIISAQYGF